MQDFRAKQDKLFILIVSVHIVQGYSLHKLFLFYDKPADFYCHVKLIYDKNKNYYQVYKIYRRLYFENIGQIKSNLRKSTEHNKDCGKQYPEYAVFYPDAGFCNKPHHKKKCEDTSRYQNKAELY